MNYKKFIEARLNIIDKHSQNVPFILNNIQDRYIAFDSSGRDIILKARQQGFSSAILGRFTGDFILRPHSQSVVVADNSDNAITLLERVKFYIKSYEDKTGFKIPLKYNNKYELHNEYNDSKYTIGTAENAEFGRSRTITNLHLSEAAFYPHFRLMIAGALQAVVPEGYVAMETTANGFNEFKEFWEDSTLGLTGFKPLFYKASDFYDEAFLAQKKLELKERFVQEYPETAQEAFLTSGASFFNTLVLKQYMEKAKDPANIDLIYA